MSLLAGTRRVLLGNGASELNLTCPPITPVLGAELIVNGDFSAWTADNPDNWNTVGEVGADPEVSEVGTGEGHGGAGTGKCNLYSSATDNAPQIQKSALLTAGEWYQAGLTIDTVIAGSYIYNFGGLFKNTQTASALLTGRATATYIIVRGHLAAIDITLDDVTCKAITFTSTVVLLGQRSQRPGTYTCTPTVAADTQCGILIGYQDTSNFVMAIVNRVAGQAQLIKCITGVWTSVIAGAITYGAAKALKVIVAANGTDYSLYYDGVQIGSTTAINDAGLGTAVYGFSTLAGNSVGTVTTTSATS